MENLCRKKIVVRIDRESSIDISENINWCRGPIIKITNYNGRLNAQATGQQKNEMFAESDSNFF